MKFENKKEFYSLRKFKGVGLASALVGLMFLGSAVKADETVPTNNEVNTTVVSNVGEVHSEHGKVLYTDESVLGSVGKLYEDGTYILQSEDGTLYVDNLNGGLNTFLMSIVHKEDDKQIDDATTLNSMIKTVKFDGNMIVDKLDIAVGVYH